MSEDSKPKPKSKLAELEQKLDETESSYKRALADYQNLIKQTSKERQEYIRYANSSLLANIFPLLDQLQMAATHLQDPGLEMILKQFQQLIVDEGIAVISPPPGEPFDHLQHECIDTVETETADQIDQIAELVQVGYRWKDGAVLRPAKVKVYKPAEEPSESGQAIPSNKEL